MARIPYEEIERLKKKIPIDRLVTGFGAELKRQGQGSSTVSIFWARKPDTLVAVRRDSRK